MAAFVFFILSAKFVAMPKYSFIVPVYNRPDEVNELLQSLQEQQFADFDITIVEDGSTDTCQHIVEKYTASLPVNYMAQPNSGPSGARNNGAAHSKGDYLIFLDSDVIVPQQYLEAVDKAVVERGLQCFGGPDASHPSFSPIQKAISHSMTSVLTTGGIRGKKENMDKFYPRSFNMGISREAFQKVGGFSDMRFGEDVDFSMRLIECGFKAGLIKDAFVFHKRRTSFKSFFKQVYNSGIARINLSKRHPGTLKIVHLLPAAFFVGNILLLAASCIWPPLLALLALPAVAFFADALLATKSFRVSILAVAASYVQLCGYGCGFCECFLRRVILRQGEFTRFVKNFYKK